MVSPLLYDQKIFCINWGYSPQIVALTSNKWNVLDDSSSNQTWQLTFDRNEPTDVSSANYIYLVLHPYLAPTSSTHLYRNMIFVTTTITWVKLPYNLVMIVGGAIHLEWIQVSPRKWWIWAGKLCCLALSMEIFDIWHFSTISSNKHDWSILIDSRMPSWKPVPQRCAGASMPGSGPLDMLISEIPLPSEFVMFFFEAMLPTPIDSNTSSTSISSMYFSTSFVLLVLLHRTRVMAWYVMACVMAWNSTRTAEAEALEATAAAFRGSGEKACCQ